MPQQTQQIQVTIGDYQVRSIPTGLFGLDGGAMFGTVPKVLWEKTNPADEKNQISLEARALLLISDAHKILVDCGVGRDFVGKYGERMGGKFALMYGVQDDGPSLKKSLANTGLNVEDIDTVILTHLHFDHAGGATCFQDGLVVPTFPNATYYVQQSNLETAQSPNLREKASYLPENFKPLIEKNVLKLLSGDIENLFPNVSVFVSNGHTQGQQLVRVSDEKNTLVYCGDIVPTSTHVRLPFVMGYDLDPLKVIEEKREILTKASQGHWYLYLEHDPISDAVQVAADQADFKVSHRWKFI